MPAEAGRVCWHADEAELRGGAVRDRELGTEERTHSINLVVRSDVLQQDGLGAFVRDELED